jgi:plastocyanin
MKVSRRLAQASLVALMCLATLSAAASAQPRAATVPGAAARVRIVDFAFMPRSVTIAVGGGVSWKNTGASPHTTTSDTGEWDSGVLNPGSTFSHRFNSAGTFFYHCNIHPFMTAKVTVTGT